MNPDQQDPPPNQHKRMGRVEATVQSPKGDPMAHFGIKITALTPTELQDIAYSTNASGVIRMGLYPGRYVISAHGRDELGQELQRASPEMLVESERTVTINIVVRRAG